VIATSVINILWTFTCGSKFDRDNLKLKRLFHLLNKRAKVFDMSGGTLSQMPWMRFIAPESSGFNLINSLNKEFYELFMEVVEEHLKDFREEKAGDDLVYAFIKEMKDQENNPNSTFTIKQLIMVILDIFIAGATTTSTTIDLALMSMLLYPEIQHRCREEITKVNVISYADRHLLPFTQATLLECQRYFSITPVTGPRRTLNTCKLHDYEIPKNTTILIGSRSILEDESFWKDPENFRPERFLDGDMKIIQNLQER
jgi:cytochrome P450